MEHFTRRGLQAVAAFGLASLAALTAQAQGIPRDEGFMKPPSSVQNRIYSLDGKSDFGIFAAMSMKNQLTEHYGLMLTFDKAFNEYVALDVLLGGGYGGLTNLAKSVRDTAKLSGVSTDLADSGALLATGQLGLRLTPAYGKLNLSSELPVHFNAYFDLGVGGALVRRESVLVCSKDLGSGSHCPGDAFKTTAADPGLAFNVGGGFRFYIDQRWSAKVEVRDVIFPDKFSKDVNLKNPVTSPGTAADAGITHVPLVLVGVGIML